MLVGSLSLGAPWTTQIYANEQGLSALPDLSPLGVDDQSRVLGLIGSFDLGFNSSMLPPLVDISFGVESGGSPFGNGLIPRGLLHEKSQAPAFPVTNPNIPHLFSEATCSAVAKNLPVAFQPSLGLSTWNTADPRYTSFFSSPTYLSFIFLSAGPSRLNFKVPIQVLHLTLVPPLVPTP